MKSGILIVIFIIGVLYMTVLSEDNQNNIEILKKAAYETYPNNKILAQLTIAQGILESNLEGKAPSKLAIQYNNLFGVKAKQLEIEAGQAILLPTHEYQHGEWVAVHDYFRVYSSVEDCLEHRKELFKLEIYQNLWTARTFWDAANLVRQDGYATDPKYSKELLDVYNRYIKGD